MSIVKRDVLGTGTNHLVMHTTAPRTITLMAGMRGQLTSKVSRARSLHGPSWGWLTSHRLADIHPMGSLAQEAMRSSPSILSPADPVLSLGTVGRWPFLERSASEENTPLAAPTSVRFFKSESLDNARPQEPGTFCHQDPFLVLLCPLWPQTFVSPPGLMPDRVWVGFKASEKEHATRSPATGRHSLPGETWSIASCCLGQSPPCPPAAARAQGGLAPALLFLWCKLQPFWPLRHKS